MPIELSAKEALPGLATAFDDEAMKGYLQEVLFGADYVVERCTARRPLYVPGESCLLRYRVAARNRASGEILEPVVTGRVFPDRSTCTAYMNEKLVPLVERMQGRPEVAAYAAPAAMIGPLGMVVHIWPVDGELPTLVDATDRARMIDVLREMLPEPFEIEDCEIELVSYRRRQRCVLRYTVAGEEGRLIAYGKVSGVGNHTPKDAIIGALRDRIAERGFPERFTVPRSLGWRRDLQLSLLEAVAGEALIGPALDARLRGLPPSGVQTLEDMVDICGQVAAAVHTSGVTLGPTRTLDDELAGLQRELAPMRSESQIRLDRIAMLGEQSERLPLRLAHGDFKYEQLLFDGPRSALVDFDALCQAEPALDLGKFAAHMRVAVRRIEREASQPSELADELVERFLRAYLDAPGDQLEDEPQLRTRTALYETVALLRLTLRDEQNLDEARLELTSALLEERLASLVGEAEQR